MNLNAAKRMVVRNTKKLLDLGIEGPLQTPEGALITDGYAGVFAPLTEEVTLWASQHNWPLAKDEYKFNKMMAAFVPKKRYDTAVFKTTAGDIWDWAVLNTGACPKCEGARFCTPPPQKAEGKNSPKEEDALAVHYGWVGAVPIDRRRLHEILVVLDFPKEQPITLSAFLDPETTTRSYFGGVRLDSQNRLCGVLAGLHVAREGETRFQTDGRFADVKLRHGK